MRKFTSGQGFVFVVWFVCLLSFCVVLFVIVSHVVLVWVWFFLLFFFLLTFKGSGAKPALIWGKSVNAPLRD